MATAMAFYQHDGMPSYIHEGSFHKMVLIRLHGSVISVSFQQHCTRAYSQCISLNLIIDPNQCPNQVTFWLSPFL
jgi:hypothetical protein